MPDPRGLTRERTVLVIDEGLGLPGLWIEPLSQLFAVVTTASLAGASVAIGGHEIAAVVLVLGSAEGSRARTQIEALRRRRSFEQIPVFVICQDVSMLAAELVGLSHVEVLDRQHAEYDLSLQIGAAASRMSSRPAPRRVSAPLMPPVRVSEVKALAPTLDPGQRLLMRFAQDCGERGQRGLLLCERLSSREASALERQRAADDLRSLLNFIRADALALQQSELANLLGLAAQIIARLNTLKGQVMVPRGVVGLLSAVSDMRSGPEQLGKFDAELHRIRLESALERP